MMESLIHSNYDVVWFQNTCQLISKNPAVATNALEEFMKSDVAIETCCAYLSLFSSLNETTFFHALSCLHRAMIVKWNVLSIETKSYVKKLLLNQLKNILHIVPIISNFGTNKLMQVFVSIWKRGWMESTEDERSEFFSFLAGQINEKETALYTTMILRVIIEEFSTQSYAESNIQYGFHINTKKYFQKNDLLKVFELAVQPLCTLLSIVKNNSSTAMLGFGTSADEVKIQMLLISELSKLLIELLEWNFDDEYSNIKSNISCKEHRCSKLPKEWHMYITSTEFIEVLFSTLHAMLNRSLNYVQQIGEQLYRNCFLNVRNLILHLPCINGEIFHSIEEKLHYGNYFLNALNNLIHFYIPRTCANDLLVTDNSSYDYAAGGTRQDMLNLFVNAFIRFIGNYKIENAIKMYNFEAVLMTFGFLTLELSKEMHVLGMFLMKEVDDFETYLIRTSDTETKLSSLPKQSEVLLFHTWRADIISSSLDLWSIIFEDLLISEMIIGINGASIISISVDLIQWLKDFSNKVFQFKCEILKNSTIFETVCEAEDDNDEENELIDTRSMEDIFTGVSIVGRISFLSSLELIFTLLHNNLNESNSLTERIIQNDGRINILYKPCNRIKCLKCLESCRVIIELLSYLLFENFHFKSCDKDSEKPRINNYILFFLQNVTNHSFDKLMKTCYLLIEILSLQIHYMITYRTDYPLVSPIVLHGLFHFFNELIICYIDADPDSYMENYSILMQHLNGDQWNALLERLYQCAHQTLLLLPLEIDLVMMISSCILSIAKSRNQARISQTLQNNSILEIANLISTVYIGLPLNNSQTSPSKTTVILLNPVCLSQLYEAFSTLFIKANSETHFNQLLVNTFNGLQQSNIGDSIANVNVQLNADQFYRIISAMSGLAKCPKGYSLQLFDSSWPLLRSNICKYKDVGDQSLLRQFLMMLLNIGEHQLLSLSNSSCMELYRTVYDIIQIFSERFHKPTASHSASCVSEEENILKSELSIQLLDVLNTLSVKDFAFFDDDQSDQFQSFEYEISVVLIYGLEVLLPMITFELLENYTAIAERLFSFISFVAGNYTVRLVQWINHSSQINETGLSGSSTRMQDLLSRLFWATGSIDGSIARSGFNVRSVKSSICSFYSLYLFESLQTLLTHQWKCKFNRISNQEKIPLLQNDFLLQHILEYLIQSMFYGTILTWDRVDSFANVLITVIALDLEFYNRLIQSYIETKFSIFEESKLVFIVDALKHLSCDRNVDLRNIDKANRLIFVLNFREFVAQIKSISFF